MLPDWNDWNRPVAARQIMTGPGVSQNDPTVDYLNALKAKYPGYFPVFKGVDSGGVQLHDASNVIHTEFGALTPQANVAGLNPTADDQNNIVTPLGLLAMAAAPWAVAALAPAAASGGLAAAGTSAGEFAGLESAALAGGSEFGSGLGAALGVGQEAIPIAGQSLFPMVDVTGAAGAGATGGAMTLDDILGSDILSGGTGVGPYGPYSQMAGPLDNLFPPLQASLDPAVSQVTGLAGSFTGLPGALSGALEGGSGLLGGLSLNNIASALKPLLGGAGATGSGLGSLLGGGGLGSLLGTLPGLFALNQARNFASVPNIGTGASSIANGNVSLDPSINATRQNLMGNYGSLGNDLSSNLNTYQGLNAGSATNLKGLLGQLGGNQDAFMKAQVDPLRQQFATQFGQLNQSLGARGISGSSFGDQALTSFNTDAGRALGNAGASALQNSLTAQQGLNRDIMSNNQSLFDAGNITNTARSTLTGNMNTLNQQRLAQELAGLGLGGESANRVVAQNAVQSGLYGRAFDSLGRGLSSTSSGLDMSKLWSWLGGLNGAA